MRSGGRTGERETGERGCIWFQPERIFYWPPGRCSYPQMIKNKTKNPFTGFGWRVSCSRSGRCWRTLWGWWVPMARFHHSMTCKAQSIDEHHGPKGGGAEHSKKVYMAGKKRNARISLVTWLVICCLTTRPCLSHTPNALLAVTWLQISKCLQMRQRTEL